METGQVRAEKNWNFCALCKQETEEKIVCPLNSKRKNYGSGYKSLAIYSNFVRLVNCQFKSLCQTSMRETEQKKLCNMKQNGTSCALTNAALFSCRGLRRGNSRTAQQKALKHQILLKLALVLGCPQKKQQKSFFCDKTGESLRRAATLTLDSKV